MISHAIFASSHPTPPPPRTASSSTPPPTPRFAPHLALHFTPHLAPRFTPHPSLHSHPASRLSCTPHPAPHHALHPAPRPPFPSLSLSQVSSSSRPPISHPRLSTLRVPQSSPFTLLCATLHPPRTPSCTSPCAPSPFHTTHFHRISLHPSIPLAKSLPSTSLHLLPVHQFPIRVSPSLLVPQPSPACGFSRA